MHKNKKLHKIKKNLHKNKNCKRIKNKKKLRPIGNLNACFKLFSGVISNRLEKVMHSHTITHKSQNAYSKINTIHEGILHTYELISNTVDANASMPKLSLDFSAAFDNLSHKHMYY